MLKVVPNQQLHVRASDGNRTRVLSLGTPPEGSDRVPPHTKPEITELPDDDELDLNLLSGGMLAGSRRNLYSRGRMGSAKAEQNSRLNGYRSVVLINHLPSKSSPLRDPTVRGIFELWSTEHDNGRPGEEEGRAERFEQD